MQEYVKASLRVRFHYGHPDIFDRIFHITNGGISKASKVINLSEDIFAGFKSTLRGGYITHHEYIQVGKGRDLGMNQISAFEAKVSNGNGEQTISRDVNRLGLKLKMVCTFIGNHPPRGNMDNQDNTQLLESDLNDFQPMSRNLFVGGVEQEQSNTLDDERTPTGGEQPVVVVATHNSPALSNVVVPTKPRRSGKLNPEPSSSKHNDELMKKNAELKKQLKDIQRSVDELKSPRSRQQALDLDSAPLNQSITVEPYQEGFKIPHLETYDGSDDSDEHLHTYQAIMKIQNATDAMMCKREIKRTTTELMQVHQKKGESLRDYMQRFNKATLDIDNVSNTICLFALLHGLKPGRFLDDLLENPPKSWNEVNDRGKGINSATIKILIKGVSTHLSLAEPTEDVHSTREELDVVMPHANPFVAIVHIGNHNVNKVFVDMGSSPNILYWSCFQKIQLNPASMQRYEGPIYGFDNQPVPVEGVITLPIYMGTEPRFRMAFVSFLVVKMESAYNAIIGKATLCELKVVISQPHLYMKFPTPHGVGIPSQPGLQAMSISDIDHRPKNIEHKAEPVEPIETIPLNLDEPEKTVKIGTKLTEKERAKLLEFLKANQDVFAWTTVEMPRISSELAVHKLSTDSTKRPVVQKHRLMGPKKQAAIDEEEKTVFYATDAIYCYVMMLFGLKNAGATYQNVRAEDHIDDLKETFQNLRGAQMRLNPLKCTFAVESGKFLWYVVSKKGIEVTFALVCTVRKLRAYFQSHKIVIYTDLPLKKILQKPKFSGRLIGWVIELSEYDLKFQPRTTIKGQALVDFIVECHPLAIEETVLSGSVWALFIDGAVSVEGSGVGAVLTGPNGFKSKHPLRFNFKTMNNAAEYEALIYGLKLASELKASFCGDYGIELSFTSVYTPQSNGQAESANKIVLRGLKTCVLATHSNWVYELNKVLWSCCTTPNSAMRETPFSLAYEAEVVLPMEVGLSTNKSARHDNPDNEQLLRKNLDLVKEPALVKWKCREPALEAAVGSTGKNLKIVVWRAQRKDTKPAPTLQPTNGVPSWIAGSGSVSRLCRADSLDNPATRALCPAGHLMTPND
ncbi:hypothetical protein SLEP1_g26327 [Rubroshorea leprosula]|uniref:RNA-directed DNA polymerase n=1 Tax=Rubroshorea leprosula TaxID=152421 RepID=A0AAV5JTS5_9ROSI|nr:hypothetical protein SLEP1_g26327 [Rubroshorea leprosula]